MGRKGLFGFQCHGPIHHQRKPWQELKQGRYLEVGVESEAMEESSSLFSEPAFLTEVIPTSPVIAPPLMG